MSYHHSPPFFDISSALQYMFFFAHHATFFTLVSTVIRGKICWSEHTQQKKCVSWLLYRWCECCFLPESGWREFSDMNINISLSRTRATAESQERRQDQSCHNISDVRTVGAVHAHSKWVLGWEKRTGELESTGVEMNANGGWMNEYLGVKRWI